VILTGAGEKAFVAGADISELRRWQTADRRPPSTRWPGSTSLDSDREHGQGR